MATTAAAPVERATVPLLVVGGSAGSLGLLLEIVNGLPPTVPAAVLVCLHTTQDGRSNLPLILARRAQLPVSYAVDGAELRPAQVYVAPPGRHLMVSDGHARVSAGPRVNRHRPSVDVLFASAAQHAGPGTTAVVLSGVLDDGAVGSALVDLAGGRVLAQDPGTAEFANMPRAALAAAPGARIMRSGQVGDDILAAVGRTPSTRPGDVPPATTDREVDVEPQLADDPGFLEPGESRLTRIACPECGGGLAQVDLPQISYFRCHVGHQYAPQSLAAAQSEAVEQKLWTAVAALEEQAVVQNYLEGSGMVADGETRPGTYRSSAEELTQRAVALREQVQRWSLAVDRNEAGPTS